MLGGVSERLNMRESDGNSVMEKRSQTFQSKVACKNETHSEPYSGHGVCVRLFETNQLEIKLRQRRDLLSVVLKKLQTGGGQTEKIQG
jgi:hypothetical protein